VLGDERTAQTTPAAHPHHAKASRPSQRFDAVERSDDTPFDAGVMRPDSRQRDDRASVVRTQRCHTPTLAPDPNGVADAKLSVAALSVVGFSRTPVVRCARIDKWRILHRAFAARTQKLPHTLVCGQKVAEFLR